MIAIIPARGGSKGLPGKNIRLLNEKPLIVYAIEAALGSKYIERVIVTTDSKEIAEVARTNGAEVPFMRPDELSTDTAMAVDVYLHAIEYLVQEGGEEIKNFMVLLPTTPLRTSQHINAAIETFEDKGATTLISVKEVDTPVSWYMEKDSDNRIFNAGFGTGNAITNRQVNLKYYVPNGAIYILNYELLKTQRTYYCNNTIGFEMRAEDSVDIDTMLDFKFAEFLLREKKECKI